MTNNTTILNPINIANFNLTAAIPTNLTDGIEVNGTIVVEKEMPPPAQDASTTGVLTYTFIFLGIIVLIALVIALV